MNTSRDFKFDLDAKQTRLTRSDLLAGLQAFAKLRRGRGFTIKEFDQWKDRPFSSTSILRRFGRWNAALQEARVRPARVVLRPPEELMTTLELVWRKVERPPGLRHLKRYGRITAGPYIRIWGSLDNARRKLSLFHAGKITRDEMLYPPPPQRPRPTLKPSVRFEILERDGHRCRVCGKGAKDRAVLEVDHIKPVSAGGGNDPENLRVLCRACNRGKGGKKRGRRKAA